MIILLRASGSFVVADRAVVCVCPCVLLVYVPVVLSGILSKKAWSCRMHIFTYCVFSSSFWIYCGARDLLAMF